MSNYTTNCGTEFLIAISFQVAVNGTGCVEIGHWRRRWSIILLGIDFHYKLTVHNCASIKFYYMRS